MRNSGEVELDITQKSACGCQDGKHSIMCDSNLIFKMHLLRV